MQCLGWENGTGAGLTTTNHQSHTYVLLGRRVQKLFRNIKEHNV